MTRWLTRALFVLALLVPVAAAARDAITVGLQLEPPNLDPTSGAAAAIDDVTYATIFEGLVAIGRDGAIRPWLASGWTVSPDRLTYTFRLRSGVRFHDGGAMDARAVAFSLERAIAPGSSNAQALALRAIRRIELIDPLTVRLSLAQPDADLLRLLTYGDAVIVSPRSAGALAERPVGTGPFRFAGWRRGDAITLDRNPSYWGRAPTLRRVTYRFLADPTAAYAAMKAHDVDLFPDFPAPEVLAQLRGDPSLRVVTVPSEGEVILAMNERTGPLADVRVRRAIAQAIDRRALIDGAMAGYGTPIGSHVPPQSPDYLDFTGLTPHDPAAARRLLAAAGYPNGFALTLKLPPPSYARRSGEIVAAELAVIGIRADIRNLEWAQWLDEVLSRHAFDLTIVSHAEPFDYDIYGRPGYYFGYESAAFRQLLARLKLADDPVAHRVLMRQLQRRLAEDVPAAYLFQFPHLGVEDAGLAHAWVNTPNEVIDLTAARFAGAGADAGDAPASSAARIGRWAAALSAVALLGAIVARFGATYLAGRAAMLGLTFLAATLVIFVLVQVVPGDPAQAMMGVNGSPEAIAALHAALGLEGGAPARYLRWLAGMAHGDLGTSYTYRVPVSGLIAERLGVSLPLALLATLVSIAIGVPAGYLAVRFRGRATDRVIAGAARLGLALPSFWLAILLILLFSVTLRWSTAGGFPGWASPSAALEALTLPVAALALPQAAILARVTRGALLDQLGAGYLATARAKGLSEAAALRRHALPNALGPVLTVLGLQMPFLLAGSAIVENVFFLPGLGRLVIQAIAQRDLIVVQGIVAVMVLATIVASFLVDIGYLLVDPRLRDLPRR